MTGIPLETVAAAESRAAATLLDAKNYADSLATSSSKNNLWHPPLTPAWVGWSNASTSPGAGMTRSQSSTRLTGGYANSAGASVGAWVEWGFDLDAGTWSLRVFHDKGSTYGEWEASLDGTPLGSINMHDGAGPINRVVDFTGITVATNGQHVLRWTNIGTGSGSGWGGQWSGFAWTRTA